MLVETYITAWLIYILSAICAYFIIWKMTAEWVYLDLVSLVRFFALVFIFLPWFAYDDQAWMAPAILVFLLDLLSYQSGESIRAALPLTLVSFVGVLMLIAEKYYLNNKKYYLKNKITPEQSGNGFPETAEPQPEPEAE